MMDKGTYIRINNNFVGSSGFKGKIGKIHEFTNGFYIVELEENSLYTYIACYKYELTRLTKSEVMVELL